MSHREAQMLTRAQASKMWRRGGGGNKEWILLVREQTVNKPTQMRMISNNKRLNNVEWSQLVRILYLRLQYHLTRQNTYGLNDSKIFFFFYIHSTTTYCSPMIFLVMRSGIKLLFKVSDKHKFQIPQIGRAHV